MTVLSTAPQLYLGDIVWNTNPAEAARRRIHGLPPERGIVAKVNRSPANFPNTIEGIYTISTGPGTYAISDNVWGPDTVGQWVPVPESQWTTEERARRAALRWEPPDFPQEGPMSDGDTFEWRVLLEMLPPEQRHSIINGDWPSTTEMLYLVARYIDAFRRGA